MGSSCLVHMQCPGRVRRLAMMRYPVFPRSMLASTGDGRSAATHRDHCETAKRARIGQCNAVSAVEVQQSQVTWRSDRELCRAASRAVSQSSLGRPSAHHDPRQLRAAYTTTLEVASETSCDISKLIRPGTQLKTQQEWRSCWESRAKTALLWPHQRRRCAAPPSSNPTTTRPGH